MDLATDLGADKIRILLITSGEQDTVKHISDVDCPSRSGPRHMEFSKDGKTLYCICELSGEVLAYSIDSENGTPAFTLMQKIQADEVNAGGSADIHLHPSGDYLYTSHRLDNDGIAIFRTMPDGRLERPDTPGQEDIRGISASALTAVCSLPPAATTGSSRYSI